MAILLHPMRATHDILPAGIRRGDRMYHVLSDIIGPEGAGELREAATRCGLRAAWIQYPGTYREHFDTHGRAVECFLAHGARLATGREIGELLRAKKSAGSPHPGPPPAGEGR